MSRFKHRIRVVLSSLYLLIIILIVSIYFSSNVYAQVSYVETFNKDSQLNPSIWNYIRLNNAVFSSDTTHNYLEFSGINDHTFHYLRSNQLENFHNDINVRFFLVDKGVDQGAGIAFSELSQIDGQSPNFNSYLFYLWPKPDGKYYLFTTLCPINNASCNIGIQLTNGVYKFESNKWHDLSISKRDDFGSYHVSIDGLVIFESIFTSKNIRHLIIGNSIERTSTLSMWPKFFIDEIAINTNLSVLIENNFPYYSQLDPLWRDVIYDSGDKWDSAGEGTIGRWGCAITSVSMLLKKYGMNMPDGAEPTPAVLNTWLKSQPDGYVGGGLLNWLAITRLVHTSYLSGQSPKELEFVKSNGNPSDELAAGYFPILNTGSHFVIAHKENELSYSINDPLSKLITTLPKSTLLKSVNTFIPSETNLAYILLVADPDILINLPGSEYYDEVLADENSSQTINKRLYYLRQPDNAAYSLTAQGETGSQIEVYLYDRKGQVVSDKINLTDNEPTSFIIQYDPDSLANKVMVDPTPILSYLRALRTPKKPFNGVMQALYSKFVDYFMYLTQGVETTSYTRDLLTFVNKQSPKHIPSEVKMAVQKYIRLLESN